MTFQYNLKLILSSVLLALICRLDIIHCCSPDGTATKAPDSGVTKAPGKYLSYVPLKRGIKMRVPKLYSRA